MVIQRKLCSLVVYITTSHTLVVWAKYILLSLRYSIIKRSSSGKMRADFPNPRISETGKKGSKQRKDSPLDGTGCLGPSPITLPVLVAWGSRRESFLPYLSLSLGTSTWTGLVQETHSLTWTGMVVNLKICPSLSTVKSLPLVPRWVVAGQGNPHRRGYLSVEERRLPWAPAR
jgi:hypothetical protein